MNKPKNLNEKLSKQTQTKYFYLIFHELDEVLKLNPRSRNKLEKMPAQIAWRLHSELHSQLELRLDRLQNE